MDKLFKVILGIVIITIKFNVVYHGLMYFGIPSVLAIIVALFFVY